MIVNYVLEQYLHFAYLLNETYSIFIRVPLERGHLLLFKNIMILCSMSVHYLFHFSLLLVPLGKKGLFP